MSGNKTFSIIIVTRNSSAYIGECITSVLRWTKGSEIIVIDNASSDSTTEIVSKFEAVQLIQNKKNSGFATACHSGVEQSKGEYLMFLNPDTKVTNNILDEIGKIFKNDNSVGVIGTKIIYENGETQESVRTFPNLVSQLLIVLKINHIFRNLPSSKRYLMKGFDYSKKQEVDQVMGACFSTTRTLWNTLNGFDKRFFIWFEEVDYCFRVKERGLKVIYTPIGPVIHALGKSFQQESVVKKQFWFIRSMIIYFIKRAS